jgi:hypothetical protein
MVAPVTSPARRASPGSVPTIAGARPGRARTAHEAFERGFELLLLLLGAVTLLCFVLGITADSRARPASKTVAPTAPRVEVAETERDGTLNVTQQRRGQSRSRPAR